MKRCILSCMRAFSHLFGCAPGYTVCGWYVNPSLPLAL